MKKSGQALFLILFMLAGASDSVATDDAGAVQETQRRINPNRGSANNTDQQSKKQPGWFNRCTQYVYNQAASVQKSYNALSNGQKYMFNAAAAAIALSLLIGHHYYECKLLDKLIPILLSNSMTAQQGYVATRVCIEACATEGDLKGQPRKMIKGLYFYEILSDKNKELYQTLYAQNKPTDHLIDKSVCLDNLLNYSLLWKPGFWDRVCIDGCKYWRGENNV